MALRSSPRLRALFQSDPSGKRAVFVPRLTRLASGGTAKKVPPVRTKPSPARQKTTGVKESKCSCVLEAVDCVLKEKQAHRNELCSTSTDGISTGDVKAAKKSKESSQTHRSRTRPSARTVTETTPTKRCRLRSRNTKNNQASRTEGGRKEFAESAIETVRAGEQNCKPPIESSIGGVIRDGATAETALTLKRKRGRPPTSVKNSKRVKVASVNESFAGEKLTPSTRKEGVVVSNTCRDVIDLTCDDEMVGDEDTDAATIVPASFVNPELSRTHSAPVRLTTEPSELKVSDSFALVGSNAAQEDQSEGEGGGSEIVESSLSSGESLSTLYDLDNKGTGSEFDNHVHVPSLKRSNKISVLGISSDKSERQHSISVLDSSSSETVSDLRTEPPFSPTEEEFPQPSTQQQKLIRRLARQKQLEEMKAREAALSREERLLRRRGVLPSRARQKQSVSKKISWKDDTNLIEMFIYSPVKDDDDDTVSINSDDAVAMETSLAVT